MSKERMEKVTESVPFLADLTIDLGCKQEMRLNLLLISVTLMQK